MYSHCETLWTYNPGAALGHHPTEDYAEGLTNSQKHGIIDQQRLRPNILSLWIRISLTTDANIKLRAFKNSYYFNGQYCGYTMIFLVVKMVRPDTCAV